MAHLALRQGKSWEQFLDETSSWEVTFWKALDNIDHCVGPVREDLRAAVVAKASFNCFGNKSELEDWMLKFDEDTDQTEANRVALSEARLEAFFANYEQMQGGSDGKA